MDNEHNLAYLAGILDGEGHMSVTVDRKNRRHFAAVGVSNTSWQLMEWLHSNFGGNIIHRTNPANKQFWRDRYEWRIYTKAIDGLLPKVLPFLVVKAPQARLILDLRESLKSDRRITDEVFAQRESIKDSIRSLNGRTSSP